ncbi:hypothetical protein [Pseudosulfitobacter pseudonitzschiae]|nr:hypothetical protein [Pseudosulfitobacter pseudonitzschiae]|tara:strand:+ start:1646 stop:1777 length:132 start_codon:yes stop_codon:yes gene_type:complete
MKKSVYGVTATAPRITRTAAILLATGLSIPTFAILTLVEALLF